MRISSIDTLKAEISHCDLCEQKKLIAKARPCFQINHQAKILIASQAPGRLAHESGLTFNDPSGDRLRDWMGVSRACFYSKHIAIVPMGFCYPGKAKFGDLPPVPLCAQTWHRKILSQLTRIQLTLSIGQYSQKHYLGDSRKRNLTETVRHWKEYFDTKAVIPLPHPSPLNNIWIKKNPWFESEVLPELAIKVNELMA